MKKKLMSILITMSMLVTFLPIISVSASADINIGEYLQMGTYYGEPILWRCVDIDENGPLMLSDKIISIKPFDAEGDNTSGSHGRGDNGYHRKKYGYFRKKYGSNYWADSNMRCWLNSDTSAGNVNWTCGNPPTEDKVWNGYNEYADEAGFLSNFSLGERNAIKPVTQKSLLDGYEHDSNNRNENYHRYDSDIEDVMQNYDTAYSEQVTDSVFLLDIKQAYSVYSNGNILGEDYYIGEPTAQAVENSEYKSSSLGVGNKWYFWLRSPASNHNSRTVRVVSSGGHVISYNAHDDLVGVRPAFYLNQLSARFTSGNGMLAAPYTVEGSGSYIPEVTPTPTAEPQNTSLKVYCNETSLSSVVGDRVIIGAAVMDEAGNYGSTEGLTFDVENSRILKAAKTTDDGKTRYITFAANNEGRTTIKIKDDKTGKTAELPFTVNKSSGNAYTIYNIPNLNSDDANFYNFAGLYVDSFNIEKSRDGSAAVSFDVYNEGPKYGAVEVYDANGNITDAEVIDKTAFETSIMDTMGTVFEIGKDISEGVYNPLSYKSSIQTKKTEVRNLKIPAGGYMTISVDDLNSPICGIVNQVDLVMQTGSVLKKNAEVVFNTKKITKTVKEALKEHGKEILKDYTKGFVKGMSHKTIASKESFKDYVAKLSDLYSSGYLGELAVDMTISSVSGATESAVMEMFDEAGNPATKALDGIWKFSEVNNLLYQTIMSSKRMGSGVITIQVPDGNVRTCSDVTVKCKMNDNTAVDVIKLDKNSPIIMAAKKIQSAIFGSSEIAGYDISLVEDGEEIQPSGTAEVSIDIPEWMQNGKNISVYHVDENSNVTNMNGIVSGDTITFETNHFSTYILTAEDIPTEAPKVEEGQTVVEGNTIVSDWAAEEVEQAFDENLVPEVLKGEDLTKQVDRAEFAAIAVNLYENLSGNDAKMSDNPFGDISGNYCEYEILKAYNLDITNGVTDITFAPSALISREQVATMLTRAYKKSEFPNWTLATDGDYPLNYMGVTKYADDNEISDYAKESVYFMTRWEILNGVDDTHFAPKNNVTLGDSYGYATREQAVVIALRSAKHL